MSTIDTTAGATTPSPEPGARAEERAPAPKAAKTPLGPGAVAFVGGLLALALIALGGIGLQTASSATGLTSADPWLTRIIQSADGLAPRGWILPVAVLAALVGLWLLLTALRPRPKIAVPLKARTGVFVRPRDLSRLAESAADDVDGVSSVRARATRSKVTLQLDTTGGSGVTDAVRAAVTERLEPVQRKFRVAVRTREVSL